MQPHTTGVNEISSHKDNNSNGIDPAFDFGFIDEVKAETEKLTQQANEAAEQKANQFPVEIFPSLYPFFGLSLLSSFFPTTSKHLLAVDKSKLIQMPSVFFVVPDNR